MNRKLKSFSRDMLYSVSAMVLLNVILQFFLYPTLNKKLGDSDFGIIMTLLSVVSIIASSFGSAANYSRIISSSCKKENGRDYNFFLLLVGLFSIPVVFIFLLTLKLRTVLVFVLFPVFTFFSVFRYYADVEFRINLNYKKYFIFYAVISFGYFISSLFFSSQRCWIFIFLTGELLAIVYAELNGHRLFKFSLSNNSKKSFCNWISLSLSNLSSSFIANSDRLLICYLIAPEFVAVFYVATLIGKTVSLLGSPLNSVLIGYLTKSKMFFSKKNIIFVFLATFVFGLFFTGICFFASIVFVKLMYPHLFKSVYPLLMSANAGQIFFFLSNTLMVLVIYMKGEKSSIYVSLFHLIIFMLVVIPSVLLWGLHGMTYSILIVNFLKFIFIFFYSIFVKNRESI